MLCFLQQNAEWMCAIALVYFASMQWWISRIQYYRDIRFKRMELAKIVSSDCAMFDGTKGSATKIIETLARHQSSFIFLLNANDCKTVTDLFNYLTKIRYSDEYETTGILSKRLNDAEKYIENLEYALVNATYDLSNKTTPNKKGFFNAEE